MKYVLLFYQLQIIEVDIKLYPLNVSNYFSLSLMMKKHYIQLSINAYFKQNAI